MMRRMSGRMGILAHPERFELPTDRFVADYSIQLSYGCCAAGPFYQKNILPEILDRGGCPEGSVTGAGTHAAAAACTVRVAA